MRQIVVRWSIEYLNNGTFDLRLYSEKYPVRNWEHYPTLEEIHKELAQRFEL